MASLSGRYVRPGTMMYSGGGCLLHGADLHRRGMHAQQYRLRIEDVGCRLDVERVRHQPRRVRRIEVERVEVVVDGLDLGPFFDVEAEADEHVLDLASRLGDQVQAPELRCGVGRQRDVDAVALEPLLELLRGELLGALLDRRFEGLARLVGGLAGGGALLRRERRDVCAAGSAAPPSVPGTGSGRLPARPLSLAAAMACSASVRI